MKQFKNYEEAKKNAEYTGGAKLPAGAYICKCLDVKYENGQNGNSDYIKLRFDIADGEYKDFFTDQYKNNTSEDKKYKGVATIYVPKDDGSEKDGWTANSFATWTVGFEGSNEGYHWDWDENKWKGLNIGIVFGETGTVIDGKEIVYTEARRGCSVELIKDGKAPKAKFKSKNGYTGNGTASSQNTDSDGFMNIPEGTEEEVPF